MTQQQLPSGWATTTLGDVCHKPQYGWTTKAVDKPSDMRLLRTTDISKGPIDWPSVPYCAENPPDKEKYKLQSGDIVISRAGSVGLSALIENCPDSVFASYLIRFRVLEHLDRRFVLWSLKSPGYWKQISQESAGIALQNVNAKKLATLELPLPPLPEQRHIVAEIEKHFTRLDASVAALKRVQANLKRYRASVLKSACEGKLVPTEAELSQSEGRDYEPADRLLARIVTERRAQWESQKNRRGKYKEPIPPDTTDLPDPPEGWVWASMEQATKIQGGIQKQPKRAPRDNSFPYLRVANVLRGSLDLEEVHEMELFPGELDKLRLATGDLLIVEGNGSPTQIGRMAIWNGRIVDCVHQNHVIRARACNGIIPAFVESYWNSPEGSARVLKVASSTSGLYTLSASKVSRLPVPIPPLAEQRRIVAEIDRRLSIIQQAQAAVEASLIRAKRLRQSILKQAFSGKLVPQDPNDEPASVLLERIRAERAEAEAVAKAQRKPRRRRSKSAPATRPKLSEAAR